MRFRTIGADHIAVPSAFWKVVIDPTQHQAIAFLMPQKAIGKGDLRPWQVSIETVEGSAFAVAPAVQRGFGVYPKALASQPDGMSGRAKG